jgi:hypothetical protein
MLLRSLAALAIAAALLVAGCGADDEEEAVTQPVATTPTVAQPTAPAPTATVAAPTTTAPKAAPKPTPAAPTASPNACTTEKTISRLKFQGVPCEGAAALAAAWEKEQNRCSTIDDPSKPEGYNRTCELEGYTCQTKRDVRSDARFVACTTGGAQVRFTWSP